MSALPIHYSRGVSKFDNTPAQHTADDFAQFRDAIVADRAPAKGRQYISAAFGIAADDAEHRAEPGKAKAIGNPHRCHSCAMPRRWIGLDVDDKPVPITPEGFAALVGILHRYSGVVYTTASHKAKAPRCRIVLELDCALPRADLIRAAQAIRARIDAEMIEAGHLALPWDTACDKPEQPLYLPPLDSQVYMLDGAAITASELLAELPMPAESPPQATHTTHTTQATGPDRYALAALDSACRAIAAAPEGARNNTLNREAHSMGGFIASGRLWQAMVENVLVDAAARAGWPDHERDVAKVRAGIASGMTKPRSDGLTDAERPAKNNPAPSEEPKIRTATDLLAQHFGEVQWAVRGIIPEGISILSGDPKIGKSWLLFQACVAIAGGAPVWAGRDVEMQGDVLMLALEDNDRRLQRRLQALMPRFMKAGKGRTFTYPDVTRLHYATEWPRAEEGVEKLKAWLEEHPGARMIVIDTVSAFRKRDVARNKTAYAADYEIGEMFKPLAREYACAIVLVMHNRKQHSDDVLQLVSGTQGMTGGVDNVLVMRRERGRMDAGLYVDGRDIEEPQELALHFDKGYWSSNGQSVDEARMSDERRRVLRVVADLGDSAKVRAIADALAPKKYESVRSMLSKMVKSGDLRLEEGVYLCAGTMGTGEQGKQAA